MNSRHWITLSAACFFLLCPLFPAFANPSPEENLSVAELLSMPLEKLVELEVSLATGTSKPLRIAPAVATVITAADIERVGATTLDEVLETVPGLHVLPSGSNIFSKIWSIRGIHTSTNPQILLLINGIPLTPASTGSKLHSFRLPVSMISRVEVIRGPGSAVHGADAFSGAVNVVTKDAREITGTQAGIRYGSFDTVDAWLQHGDTYRGWDLYGAMEVMKSDGDDGRVVNISRSDLAAQTNVPGALDTNYNLFSSHLGLSKDNLSFRLFGEMHYDNGVGPSPFQALNKGSRVDGQQLLADLEYRDREFSPDWDVGFRFYWAYMETDNFFEFLPPGVATYMMGNPIAIDRNTGTEATAYYEGVQDHRLRFSVGWRYNDMDIDQYKNFGLGVPQPWFTALVNINDSLGKYMDDQSRRSWNVSFQDEWDITSRWNFTAGARYDHYNDFGSTINPRAALVWDVRSNLTSKLLYGRAFRAPSFGEQHNKNTPTITGNPDVDPETMDTYELAFDYHPTSNLQTKLNLFHYRIDGLIAYVSDPAPATTSTARNSKNQEGHGFEIEANWQIRDDLMLRANAAYQRSKDEATNELVSDAPEMQFYLNPHWDFLPDWSLGGQFYWIAGRHRENNDPRPEISDYTQTNLILRRKNIADHWGFAVAVTNVFDQDIREPSPYDAAAPTGAWIPNDYPMEGRSIWVELRYSF